MLETLINNNSVHDNGVSPASQERGPVERIFIINKVIDDNKKSFVLVFKMNKYIIFNW
jgi:hypothetical protein